MLVLLVDASTQNAKSVVERILNKYKTEMDENAKTISYEIQQVIPEEAPKEKAASL